MKTITTNRKYHMRKLFSMMISLFCLTVCNAQTGTFDYFGQIPPGDTVEVFAPGILSVEGRREKDLAISPAGDELFFMSGDHFPNNIIMRMVKSGGTWSAAETASFSKGCNATRPCFSPDGQYLYYASNKGKSVNDFSLWRVKKNGSDWSDPENIIDMGGSSMIELDPRVTENAVYFVLEGNPGNFIDIYKSEINDGEFSDPVKVENPISTWYDEGGLYVDVDETYMLLLSGRNRCDSYVSYKKDDGTWTNPKDLGPAFDCYTTIVSPDGNYFFIFDIDYDIYWVRAGNLIDSLRHTNFVPYVKTPLADQVDSVGYPFDFPIPDSTFFDDDGNNTFTCSATLKNGDPLPGWLEFDTLSLTFSGTPSSAEKLTVRVTAKDTANAEVSSDFKIEIKGISGMKELKRDNEIMIFPNPSAGIFTIKFSKDSFREIFIDVFDLSGKLVLTLTDYNVTEKIIDMSGFPKGTYIVRISNGENSVNHKIRLE